MARLDEWLSARNIALRAQNPAYRTTLLFLSIQVLIILHPTLKHRITLR